MCDPEKVYAIIARYIRAHHPAPWFVGLDDRKVVEAWNDEPSGRTQRDVLNVLSEVAAVISVGGVAEAERILTLA